MVRPAATNPPSSRELVAAYLCAQIDELQTHEPGARIDSPDAVHRMRGGLAATAEQPDDVRSVVSRFAGTNICLMSCTGWAPCSGRSVMSR